MASLAYLASLEIARKPGKAGRATTMQAAAARQLVGKAGQAVAMQAAAARREQLFYTTQIPESIVQNYSKSTCHEIAMASTKRGFDAEGLHVLLDALGLVPVFGEVFDLANGIWYLAEDDTYNSGLSLLAVIPIIGWAAIGAKYLIKGAKIADAASGVARGVKVVDAIGAGSRLPTGDSQLKHISRDAPGHIIDTPANRTLLEGITKNINNFRGVNASGNEVYTYIQRDGTQIWVYTRNGVIQNGGVNTTPVSAEDLLRK